MKSLKGLLAIGLASAAVGSPAAAVTCDFVVFEKRTPPRDETGATVETYKDLKDLRSWQKLSDKQIERQYLVRDMVPPGCTWKRLGSGGGGSGGTVVLTSGGYSAPAAPASAPASPTTPPARRDAWGKRSPTPSPPRDDSPASGLPDDGPFAAEIAQAATRYRMPAQLVRAVMQVESGGNPLVVSHKGAVGLMQLLPATAAALGVEDINDPAQNIMGGTRFLRVLANKFEGDLVKVLSGYHAGSMRVLSRDATPFAATDDYVRKVLKTYYQLRDAALRDSGG